MKIKHKIMLSDIFNLLLFLLIGFFAYQNFNLILTKLRFVEIADDLNASFLEMRIAEKNYFLYNKETSLLEITEKIKDTQKTIDMVKEDILRAIGKGNFEQLQSDLKEYADVTNEVRKNRRVNPPLEKSLRGAGKKLREFSRTVTDLERTRVNKIILNSEEVLITLFWAILFGAVIVNHLVSKKILNSLGEIETLAKSISKGVFKRIRAKKTNDELGSVMDAIDSMSDELKHREEEIIQSKKLASIGILTAGVAHELNNPLNNISMIAQTYIENYDLLNQEQRLDFMNKIEQEAERIKKVVMNLLDFSKPQKADLMKWDINFVVKKALKLLQNMINISNIDTELNLGNNLPLVLIDEHQIQQVFVNLIVNAIQAMAPKGKLSIATKYNQGGNALEIDVTDTGHGISPEFLPHIFDPFFSTKGVGGTGLGMSVSYGIIKNHQGSIRVESKVGTGTTFVVELPIAKPEEEKDEPA
jgi:signal transduction histidine kinase